MFPARMLILCSFALVCFLLIGCQKRPTTLNQVSGKVLYKGTPLPGGLIVFSPDTGKRRALVEDFAADLIERRSPLQGHASSRRPDRVQPRHRPPGRGEPL